MNDINKIESLNLLQEKKEYHLERKRELQARAAGHSNNTIANELRKLAHEHVINITQIESRMLKLSARQHSLDSLEDDCKKLMQLMINSSYNHPNWKSWKQAYNEKKILIQVLEALDHEPVNQA